jgi:hypothetical protein
LLRDGADPFGLEVKLLQELQDGAIQGLCRNIDPGTRAADRLLGFAAVVVGIILAALAPPWPGRHLVAAEPATEQSLEEVDVLLRLALAAPVPSVVLVHHPLDAFVSLQGADGLPLSVVQLALVALLGDVDLVAEHPADDLLGVERASGGSISSLAELDHQLVHALSLEVKGFRGADVGGIGFIDAEDLPLHPEADRRGADGKPALDAPEDLVFDAHRRELPFLLRQGDHDDRLEAPCGGREVDLLAERHHLHPVTVEFLDQLEEVDDAARDAVDFRDDDHVDQLRAGKLKKLLEGGPVGVLGALAVALPVLLTFDQLLGDVPRESGRPLVLDEGGQLVELGVERAVFLLGLLVG